MSSKIVATPKTKTTKVSKPVAAVAVTPAVVVPAVPKPAKKVKEVKEVKNPDQPKKVVVPTFKQIDGTKGTFINHTRVKHYLNDGLNPGYDAAVKDLRSLELADKPLSEAKKSTLDLLASLPEKKVKTKKGETEETEAKTKFSSEIEKIKNSSLHFSKNGPMYAAAPIDEALDQLFDFGMSNMGDAKTLTVAHVLADGFSKLSLSPLYANLPSVIKAKEALAAPAVKAVDEGDAAAPEVAPEASEPAEDDNHQQGFGHYVRLVHGNLKNKKIAEGNEAVAVYRISKNVEKLGSDIVVDFLTRLIPLIRAQVDAKKVKTLSADIVKLVVYSIIGYQSGYDVDGFNTKVDDKVKALEAWIEARSTERKAEKALKEATATVAAAAPSSK